MGEKPHGEDFLPIVVDCSDESKIVGDIENGDCPIASDSHLIGMSEGLAGLGQVLPFRGSRDSVPMIEGSAGFWVCLFCFFKEFSRDDSHADTPTSDQKGHMSSQGRHSQSDEAWMRRGCCQLENRKPATGRE